MRKQLFAVIFAAVFAVGCSSNDNTTSTSGSSGSTGASGSSGSTSTSGSSGSTSSSGSSGSTSTSGSGSGSGSGSSGGSSGGPDWTCLGNETPPDPGSNTSTAVTLHFVDAVTPSSNVTGLTVKLCKLADTSCTSPDDTATDNAGTVSLNAPLNGSAYSGFFDVTGASVPETLIYLPPFASDPLATIKIITNGDLGLVGIAFGNPDTTSHGLMTGSVEDCAGAAAAGATVDVSQKDSTAGSATTVYYLSGAAPSGGSSTTTDGTFAITNVPPTDNEVVTTTNSNGDVTGSYPVVVKAGAVTTLVAAPNQ